ncbi:S8 family serine peptidase (plasmid) [Euhalothece natronophila Z-M001]|uniref:S8 family serine peptidase n=1 Tax=Euhalothece natronophila Z-M001 TaxID=522448 RepID=A0A5B8NRR5_9CHRO|nr:DVUA0089 family protein [Euhalothece natronophila]QDZ41657.1 S8 family serine peptidase [Euhalothece natronophila Z-M001]
MSDPANLEFSFDPLFNTWQEFLTEAATSGRLISAAQDALLLDDTPDSLETLVSQWQEGDFSQLPEIEVLSDSNISGAAGAYARSNETIYLNEDWLASASEDRVMAVLTEELGHHLDNVVNEENTPGDEGAIFSALALGEELTETELETLRETDDQGTIEVEGEEIVVEQSDDSVSNSVVTWGASVSGGDLTGEEDDRATGVPGGELNNVQDIIPTQESNAFAALKKDGSVVTWGHATWGGDSSNPTGGELNNVQDIFSTQSAFAALKEDNSVVTWGSAGSGGDLTSEEDDRPIGVPGGELDNVQDIFSNSRGAFAALKKDGSVVAWGNPSSGGDVTGEEDEFDRATGVTGGELNNVQEIFSASGLFVGGAFAALKEDGSVVAWGHRRGGGDLTGEDQGSLHEHDRATGVPGEELNNVQEIFSTSNAFAALKEDSSVVTWGHSRYGGNSSEAIGGELNNVQEIFSTEGAFAALKQDGSVVTWGDSWLGGDLSEEREEVTGVPDGELNNVQDIFSTRKAFAALKEDGSVVTWGDSRRGGDLIGNEDVYPPAIGVPGGELNNVQEIFSTYEAFAALKEDGSVVAWGDASRGGDLTGEEADRAIGVPGGELNNVQEIFSNQRAFAALKEDGSVVAWGHRSGGADLTGEDGGSGLPDGELNNPQNIYPGGNAFAAIVDDDPTAPEVISKDPFSIDLDTVAVGDTLFTVEANPEDSEEDDLEFSIADDIPELSIDPNSGEVSLEEKETVEEGDSFDFEIIVEEQQTGITSEPEEFSVEFTGSSLPNLTPYQPDGWDDEIVITNQFGSRENTRFLHEQNNDNIYANFAYRNEGAPIGADSHNTRLLLMGDGQSKVVFEEEIAFSPVDGFYAFEDINLGSLEPGEEYSLELQIDYEDNIEESDTNNNILEKEFEVHEVESTGNAAFDLIDLDVLRSDPFYSNLDGSNSTAAVIDSGLDGSHPYLEDNFVGFKDFVENTSFTDNPRDSYDATGHGTHVAGTVGSSEDDIGVAPGGSLLGLGVEEDEDPNFQALEEALKWVKDNHEEYGIDVVNMSLVFGGFFQTPEPWELGQKLENNNITLVGAAGNEYADHQEQGVRFPAIDSTLNVGSVFKQDEGSYGPRGRGAAYHDNTKADLVSAFSNRLHQGDSTDTTLFAPGATINSTEPTSWLRLSSSPTGERAGTSMAAPHVSGLVSLMQDVARMTGGTTLDPDTIAKILHNTADTITDDGSPASYSNFLLGSKNLLPVTGEEFPRINAYNAIEGVREHISENTVDRDFPDTPDALLPNTINYGGTFAGATFASSLDGLSTATHSNRLGEEGTEGEINDTEVSMYEFKVESDGITTIELSSVPEEEDMDTYLRLFNEDGEEIAVDDNSGEGNYSQLELELDPGTYYAGVSGAGNEDYDPNLANSGTEGDTGAYSISFNLENEDPTGTLSGANDVSLGNYQNPFVFNGVLGTDGEEEIPVTLSDVDLFRVTAPDDGELLANINTPYEDNPAETYLRVFDEDGNELYANENGVFENEVLSEQNETLDSEEGLVYRNDTFVGHETDSFISAQVEGGEVYYVGVSEPDNNDYDAETLDDRPDPIQEDVLYDLSVQFVNDDLNGSIIQATDPISLPIEDETRYIGQDFNEEGELIEVGDKDVDLEKINLDEPGVLSVEATSSDSDPVELVSQVFDEEGNAIARDVQPGDTRQLLELEPDTDYYVAISGWGNSEFDPYQLGSGTSGDTGEYNLNLDFLDQQEVINDLRNHTIDSEAVETITEDEPQIGRIGIDNDLRVGAEDVDLHRLVPEADKDFVIEAEGVDLGPGGAITIFTAI